ncbi:16S rRNA (cytosine(1402)-N(4))-methyltransferase RsmH [Tichowtungia aerotolerans]|uniref:Ribosomal RNA small subunit methyltransferase H n=1 Tax=Tichowtungia aerotolerans TaxID=2697043 RepID=A0A6P1M8Q8_9BACT|nr:16S rRNA (cytosine(1402)-N(4))-methyltransferase RsmH [Tichowtungia aerotolerans]QHI67966.1 16S rRNA (cytosine(1402)-N(4))-methyltransferase RsmH [Tichowtungia aerotolerans]
MHVPVLLNETLDLLVNNPAGTYIDGTLGRGGHSKEILKRLNPEGRLIGLDRDLEAIKQTKVILEPFGDQAQRLHGNFSEMKELCKQIGVTEVDGVLLDLGVSSPQLDVAERGFSFGKDGPLDMRMDRTQGRSAADWVNEEDEQILADVIFRFGEERDSRRIARAIVQAREGRRIERTLDLAEIVERAKGGRRGPTHPATKTFQALRMAVNAELDSLERGLEAGLSMLRDGGRMAVITFHSLEDRMVKECFKRHCVKRESLQQGGEKLIYDEPAVRLLNKKPLTASKQELMDNPRSRSAKLRVAEREKPV